MDYWDRRVLEILSYTIRVTQSERAFSPFEAIRRSWASWPDRLVLWLCKSEFGNQLTQDDLDLEYPIRIIILGGTWVQQLECSRKAPPGIQR
jgi:hypothetical protein